MISSVYDLLRYFVARHTWASETEERQAMEAVDNAERRNIFGSSAIDIGGSSQ